MKQRQTHSFVATQRGQRTTFTCDREAEAIILTDEEYAKFSMGEGCTGSLLQCKASEPKHFQFLQAGRWSIVFIFDGNEGEALRVKFER